MTARLAHIFRHPVKSVGGEALDEVRLNEGQPLPGDRRFAVLHEAAIQHLDGDELRRWLPKSAFLRGVASAPLQAISGGWSAASARRWATAGRRRSRSSTGPASCASPGRGFVRATSMT